MNDYDRVLNAATRHGWRPQGLPSSLTFTKDGKVITTRFGPDGKLLAARVQGKVVRSRVLPAVLQEMRQG